ncbi:MAG: ATP-binding cassette domain-containing protein, partial [Granulicella sp.]
MTPVQSGVAAHAISSSLQVENVGMVFDRDGKKTCVLEDISLEVGEGEFLCVLGPSGCGKSTLLNIMAGFLSPTCGEVRAGGEVIHGPDPRRIFVF